MLPVHGQMGTARRTPGSSRKLWVGSLLVGLVACANAGRPDTNSPRVRAPCLYDPDGCSGEPGVVALSGYEPYLPDAELEAVADSLDDAQVVGLGEAAHGSAGFIGIKIRISRYLIEHRGFRVIAWESSRVGARQLNAYLQTCEGDATQAVKQLHEYWADVQTRDFVQWMCRWNIEHPSDRVHVYGFDVQDPLRDHADLRALLTRPRSDGAPSPRKQWLPAARHLASLAMCDRGHDDLCSDALHRFDAALARSIAAAAEPDVRRRLEAARLALTSYAAWQRRAMISDEVLGFEVRDRGMSEVFMQLRELYFPRQKAVLWAHNIHIVKRHERVRWSWLGPIDTLGSDLARRFGEDGYRAVAVIGHDVSLYRDRRRHAAEPRPASDSVESSLHELGQAALFIDLRHPNASAVVPAYERRQLGAPAAEIHVPAENYDAILYLEQSPAADML